MVEHNTWEGGLASDPKKTDVTKNRMANFINFMQMSPIDSTITHHESSQDLYLLRTFESPKKRLPAGLANVVIGKRLKNRQMNVLLNSIIYFTGRKSLIWQILRT